MSDKQGTLRMLPSGRWAVCRPEREPVEITSGELFRAAVAGELKLTCIEYRHGAGYYANDGYPLTGAVRSQNSATRQARASSSRLGSENASATEPASLLAVHMAEEGTPLTTIDKRAHEPGASLRAAELPEGRKYVHHSSQDDGGRRRR